MSLLARRSPPARGQAAVEFSLSIMLVLTLLLGFFDLARGLAAYAAVSEMAWAGARFAASGACLTNPSETTSTCPGSGSPTPGAPPSTTVSPAQQDAITEQARAAAFAIDASAATVAVQLPDQSARLGQRVRVHVDYSYVPLLSKFAGGRAVVQLSSSQTLLIVR